MASKKKDVNEKKTKNGEEKQKNIGYFQLVSNLSMLSSDPLEVI